MAKYQTDTTRKSKREFLNYLSRFDKKSCDELMDLMQLNEHSFPDSFLITDIDKNGVNEYFINENYERTLNLCYTTRNNKMVKFLTDIPFQNFLVENPQKIWLVAQDTYLGWERSLELLEMTSDIYSFNFTSMEHQYLFKIYDAIQVPVDGSDFPYLTLNIPANRIQPKSFILSASTWFYTDYNMSKKHYQNTGMVNKGSFGWILADTLNSCFAVFDSTTSYANDSLGIEKITVKDRGYLMCWIPKKVIDFTIENPISGVYLDQKTNEFIRVIKTGNEIHFNYFSGKTFEKSLIIDSTFPEENKYVVRFKKSGSSYILIFKDNIIECTNPDQTKQVFKKNG